LHHDRYLEKNLKSFQPPPASIVELGSGNGLLGMVCALFFGASPLHGATL
jgi:tRNA1(Val) A37 N6-methylase TrmN6